MAREMHSLSNSVNSRLRRKVFNWKQKKLRWEDAEESVCKCHRMTDRREQRRISWLKLNHFLVLVSAYLSPPSCRDSNYIYIPICCECVKWVSLSAHVSRLFSPFHIKAGGGRDMLQTTVEVEKCISTGKKRKEDGRKTSEGRERKLTDLRTPPEEKRGKNEETRVRVESLREQERPENISLSSWLHGQWLMTGRVFKPTHYNVNLSLALALFSSFLIRAVWALWCERQERGIGHQERTYKNQRKREKRT